MKTMLITGSNKGIGYEVARQLGRKGYEVFISGRSAERLKAAQEKLRKEGVTTLTLLMDTGNQESIQEAVQQFTRTGRKLDVLINNAAISLKGDRGLTEGASNILTETINVNSFGPLWVTQAFLPMMRSPGRIIMVSSGGGSMTDPVEGWSPAYCVSKTLLNGITRHLAYELAGKSITVNAVCPGWVKTDMGGAGASRSVEKGAETPVWLASEAPQSLTGSFLRDKKVIAW